MAKKPAYLPLYVRDWRSDPKVALLPWTERMLYLDMLMLSWELGNLPDDCSAIIRALGASVDEAAVERVLEGFWMFDEGHGWWNMRLEYERGRTEKFLDACSENGRKGNEIRWRSGGDPIPTRVGIAKPSHSQAQAQAQAQAQEEGSKERGERSADTAPKAPKVKKPKPEPWKGVLPDALMPLADDWAQWLRYRASEHQDREFVTQLSGDRTIAWFQRVGIQRSKSAIDHTIRSQWKGLREPDAPRGALPSHTDQIRMADDDSPAVRRSLRAAGVLPR